MQCPGLTTIKILVNIYVFNLSVFICILIPIPGPSIYKHPCTQYILSVIMDRYTMHSALQSGFT